MVGSISDRTLTVFCNMLTGVKVRDIKQAFYDEGFNLSQDSGRRILVSVELLLGHFSPDWTGLMLKHRCD